MSSAPGSLVTSNPASNAKTSGVGFSDGSGDGIHIVFAIDVLLRRRFENDILMQCLDAILAFGNSFLMQSGYNRLTILGSNSVKNCVLYYQDQENDFGKSFVVEDQQNEQFAMVTQHFRTTFVDWIQECRDNLDREHQTSASSSSSLLSGSLAQALCMINSHRVDMKQSRILVFSLGIEHTDTYSSQYMKLLNCFFAAQKINVMIDACTVGLNREIEESAPVSASLEDQFAASVLQQGCDLTGGRYIRIHKPSLMLEHLFWCLTPSSNERPQYVLPPKHKIAPPAACFCHRKVLDFGFVCSVCFSIFCQFLPFCPTCNSNLFKSNLNQIVKLKQQTAVANTENN